MNCGLAGIKQMPEDVSNLKTIAAKGNSGTLKCLLFRENTFLPTMVFICLSIIFSFSDIQAGGYSDDHSDSGNVIATISAGTVRTVDADGGADYTSLDSALNAIAEGQNIDTIKFVGSDVDTFTWSTYLSQNIGTITFKGTKSDPDSFPVIIHTNHSTYNFFNETNGRFERVVITGPRGFNMGQSANTHEFINCVFRDNTSTATDPYIIHVEGAAALRLENCLFEGNTCGSVISINPWGENPALIITNCTFDNNTRVFSADPGGSIAKYVFKNNIFSGNTTTFMGNNLRGKTTYSLTSEDITGYGTGCISNSNPQYHFANRNKPSDWRIADGSPGDGIGTTTGAPSTDIAGQARGGSIDAGCWNSAAPPAKDYFWDVSTSPGIQAGNGTWGTNNYWTINGTTLVSWPGSGYSAIFGGSNGNYTITVNGTQYVDSITFLRSGYYLTGGTIDLGSKNGIYVESGERGEINSVIAGTAGIKLYGTGELHLSGNNTFTGASVIYEGILRAGNSQALGNFGNAITIANGAAIDVNGFDLRGYTQSIVINGQRNGSNGAIINSGGEQINAIRKISLGSNASIGSNGNRFDIGRGYSGSVCITGNNHILTKVGSNYIALLADADGLAGVVVNSGTLSLEADAAAGNAPITINNGAILASYENRNFSNNISINGGTLYSSYYNAYTVVHNGSITLTGNTTIGNPVASTMILSGAIGGTGNVTFTGASGTVILANNNNYSGGTTISSGTLQIGNGGTTGAISNSSNVTNNAALIFDRSNAYTYSGVISGTGTVTKNGEGELTIRGSNTYTGVTTVNSGTLVVGSGGSFYSGGSVAGSIVINAGATMRINRQDMWGVHTSVPSATVTINEGGTLISNGYFNVLGPVNINGGTLSSNGGADFWDTWSLHGTVTTGGTARSYISTAGGSNNSVKIGNTTAGGTTTFNVGDATEGVDLEVNTIVIDDKSPDSPYPSVASGLIKSGAGTMALTAANTYTGLTRINAGTITVSSLADGGTASNIGSSSNDAANLVFNGGTLQYTGAAQSSDRLFTLRTGGGTIDASGTGALVLNNTGSAVIYGTGTRTLTLTGTNTEDNILAAVIANDASSNATSITKSGDGKWILTGDNTATGTVTISAGTLQIGNNGTTGSIAGNTNNSGSLIFYRSNSLTYNGAVSGTGSLTKMGAGTLTLGGSSSYTGATVINGGTISVSSLANGGSNSNIGAASSDASNLIINGGTLRYTGSGTSSNRLFTIGTGGAVINASGSGALNLTSTGTIERSGSGTRTLTLTGNNTGANTLAAVIADDASSNATSLVKTGNGSWTLSAVNSYTGTTTVSAGTLVVTGLIASGSDVTVNGGTLAGTGAAAGPVNASNGKIAPGEVQQAH